MSDESTDTWQPEPARVREAHVTALARLLGTGSYEELHALSVQRPAEYWQVVNRFLGICWLVQPRGYVDLERGVAFPEWFPGGQLNWVDTVLTWSRAPDVAHRRAVVAEQEDGSCVAVTFAELAVRVRRCASGLRAQGVARGERIGLLMENGLEATVALLAVAHVGAIIVPLFSGFGVDAIVSRLQSSGARGLIATTGFRRRGAPVHTVPVVMTALQRLPSVDRVWWKASRDIAAPVGARSWSDVADAPDDGLPAASMSPNEAFMVIFTSGTTGRPKGAVHTHGGFPLKIAHDAAVHFDLGKGDVFCWPADMGWVAGALVLCAALMRGATLVCYTGAPDFPDWSRMGRLIERYRVTHFGSSPTLIRGLAAHAELALQADLTSVELLVTAGEVIDPEHFNWFRSRFGRGIHPLINYTGGTEVSGALLSSVVVRPIAAGAFNTGSPGIDVAVVDAAGRAVVGAVGELAIRAPFVGMTRSFWHDDARYLESYWQAVPGMWIHGDLALQTASDGYLLLGRSDDTIKLAGKRLGPAEVEEVLLELPGVHEAAAVGVQDAAKGQRLVVFIAPVPVQPEEAGRIAEAAARHVEQRLGKPFVPSEVYFVRQFPRTRNAKVMRRVIRGVCCDQPLGDLSALENPDAVEEIRAAIST